MKQSIAVLFAVIGLAGAVQAQAQETRSTEGPVVVTIIPGGGTFFTKGKDTGAPSFGNYGLGGAVEVNFNRFVGVEGEVAGALGVTQDLDFTSGTQNLKTPNVLTYNGNVVVSAANRSAVVPYVTGGVGGLTLFNRVPVGVSENETHFTGNVGGGVKWFNGRWGLRADYRFIAVRSNDDASAFFGREIRYGHRVYGGVLLNLAK